VSEQTYTKGKRGVLVRPFSQQSQVQCRSYSLPLQRVMTDFGADVPFGQIPQKLQEHHGISMLMLFYKLSTWKVRFPIMEPLSALLHSNPFGLKNGSIYIHIIRFSTVCIPSFHKASIIIVDFLGIKNLKTVFKHH
jgi:hypothetical protein